MASIERTAYPRINRTMSEEELRAGYELTREEQDFVNLTARGISPRLTLTVMLKARQQLGYFPALREIPDQIREYSAGQFGFAADTMLLNEVQKKKTLYHYRTAVRDHLSSKPYSQGGKKLASQAIAGAAETMSDPADLINVAVIELVKANIELPAFSTIDRLAGHLRQKVHDQMYAKVTTGLSPQQKTRIDSLLALPDGEQVTGFTKIKQSPGTPTIYRVREWIDRLDWLTALLDPKPLLIGIAHTKIRQFAAEASASEISDMRNSRDDARRFTLLLCLLHESQVRTRDDLIEMFLRRMKKTENAAKEKLGRIHQEHRALEENLIAAFAKVLRNACNDDVNDENFGRDVRRSLNGLGGIESLQRQCEAVSAYHQNNYLPLMGVTTRFAEYYALSGQNENMQFSAASPS